MNCVFCKTKMVHVDGKYECNCGYSFTTPKIKEPSMEMKEYESAKPMAESIRTLEDLIEKIGIFRSVNKLVLSGTFNDENGNLVVNESVYNTLPKTKTMTIKINSDSLVINLKSLIQKEVISLKKKMAKI